MGFINAAVVFHWKMPGFSSGVVAGTNARIKTGKRDLRISVIFCEATKKKICDGSVSKGRGEKICGGHARWDQWRRERGRRRWNWNAREMGDGEKDVKEKRYLSIRGREKTWNGIEGASKWGDTGRYSKLREARGRSEAVSRWAGGGDRVGRIDKFQGNPGTRPGPRFLSASVPTNRKGRTLTGRTLRRCNRDDSNDR